MDGSMKQTLADPGCRLESLKASTSDAQAGQGAPFNEKQQQAVHASAGVQAGAQPPAAPAGLPATPFDQRRGPVIDTRGLPATTPLAAEILASLNGNVLAASGTGASAAATIDAADGAAAATLSGLLQGSGSQPERQPEASAPLPSLLGNAQLASLPQAAAVAALAAAAAAGPALPVPRRQAAPPGGLLLPLSVQLGRQQRPCNCKRSMCLKMYCECFAAGGFCATSCSCLNCCNTPADVGAVQAAREVVLAKNPRAFEAKVTAAEGHKRGCRCKRSKCLKKYCECFHAGARCNPDLCQCDDCHNTEGDAMLMAMQVGKAQAAADAWAPEGSVDMLALFSASLPLGPTASDGSGGSSGQRSRAAAALPLPPLPLPPLPFALPLLPLPDAAAVSALGSLPAFDPVAAAAYLLNPTAAANLAAAATALAEQPEGKEDSLADAASFPAVPAAPAPAPSLPPVGQPFNMTSALTSHLSDVAGPGDVEMHDTATSPAPHVAIAQLRRQLAAGAAGATLTGGGRPPLPAARVRSRAQSVDSQGSADENDSCNAAGSLRSKRLRRAASGGVQDAIAADSCSGWAAADVSPPLKRVGTLPPAPEAAKPAPRPKPSDRVALLKKALAGETAAAAQAAAAQAAQAQRPLLEAATCAEMAAAEDEEDAVSALFELSASVC